MLARYDNVEVGGDDLHDGGELPALRVQRVPDDAPDHREPDSHGEDRDERLEADAGRHDEHEETDEETEHDAGPDRAERGLAE
ncbi:hypothetical protein ACFPRL_29565 [Pseudoclavibacter helvolus]